MAANAKNNLADFAEYVFGFDNGKHHNEWYNILMNKLRTPKDGDMDSPLEPAPKGWKNSRINLMAPRNFSKSTCFTVVNSLWLIGNNPNIRILIVSASAMQAQSFLREIKDKILKSPRYRQIFGDLFPEDTKSPGEKWTSSEIIVRRSASHKDPTVTALGSGGPILSKRADVIICDDILSVENTRTSAQREKIKQWYNEVLLPVLEPDGVVINVGCIQENAKVLLANGKTKRIKDIKVGEYVWSVEESTGKIVSRQVTAVLPQGEHPTLKIKTKNQELDVTPNHPFMIQEKGKLVWKKAEELALGDVLVGIKNKDNQNLIFNPVISIEKSEVQSVYDITVEDTHNFIADGLVVHNTAWNLEDLLHEQVKNPRADVRKRYKAILPNGESLWPERWPIEKLQELKEETGSIAFSKSYLNEAISSEDAVFKSSWIDEAKKKGRDRKLLYNLEGQDQQKMTVAMGVDLAISQKETGDYTAFAVVGEMEDGTKIPLYLAQEKLTFAQTQEMIKDLYQRFNPALIKVESNAYQAALVRDMQDNTSLPIKGYSTGGEKFDPDVGLQSIAVEMENGKWILPYSQESHSTMKIVDTLTDGMLRFPSGHTEDILMALWFANTGLRELSFNQEPRKVWW